jgi:diguanylate cyclase (GGDEF)-like protein
MADLDGFKSINDTYGHEVGNLVLQHTAKLIKDTIRPMDLPCRYGGEEFAILLPSTSLLTSVQVAERLRNTLANSEIAADGKAIRVTASFGICGFTADSELSEDQLIATADKQLYAAKNGGRDKVCHEPAAPSKRPQVSQDEKDLLSGLFDNGD